MWQKLTCVVVVAMIIAPLCAADTFGFRGDGTGVFTDASLPAGLSEKHVIWKTPMPGPSNSSPVIVGDHLFVLAEPDVLLCLEKSTGKEQWQHATTYEAVLDEPARQKLAEQRAAIEPLLAVEGELKKQIKSLERKIKRGDEVDASKQALDEAKEQLKANAAKQKNYPLALQYALPSFGNQGVIGFTTATPVTDGKHVWVSFASGLVTCFDMAGERRWTVDLGRVSRGMTASPLLVDGVLVVRMGDLFGLDAASGKQRWQLDVKGSHGSPAHLPDTPLLMASAGQFVNVLSGATVGEAIGATASHASPVVAVDGDGFRVVVPNKKVSVYRVEVDGTTVSHSAIGSFNVDSRMFGSPVLHADVITAVNEKGDIFVSKGGGSASKVLDKSPLRGRVYGSVARVGDVLVFVSERGQVLVLKADGSGEPLALFDLDDKVRSCPVAEGKRMYIRGLAAVHCVGE